MILNKQKNKDLFRNQKIFCSNYYINRKSKQIELKTIIQNIEDFLLLKDTGYFKCKF